MSAFLCNNVHLSSLANWICEEKLYVYGDIKSEGDETINFAVFKALYRENVKSLQARYPKDWQELIYYCCEPSEYKLYWKPVKPIAKIKAAQCFNYQACEHEDYQNSLIKRMIEHFIGRQICKIEGYENAEWEIEEMGEEVQRLF